MLELRSHWPALVLLLLLGQPLEAAWQAAGGARPEGSGQARARPTSPARPGAVPAPRPLPEAQLPLARAERPAPRTPSPRGPAGPAAGRTSPGPALADPRPGTRAPAPAVPAPTTATAPAPLPAATLQELLATHARLAAGGRGLAPTAGTAAGLGAADFAAADRDADGLLSRDEFVLGYHRALVGAGRPVAAGLAAEVTRLQALERARRAQAARPASPAPGSARQPARADETRPGQGPAVRTLIPGGRGPAVPVEGGGPAGQRAATRERAAPAPAPARPTPSERAIRREDEWPAGERP